ncbi:MAG TPA: SDR family oxidoreductase, partial [Ktedonobacterales bacterium]|nr:SDR family oxidoreductase [Ktedonobacterales bacterium]
LDILVNNAAFQMYRPKLEDQPSDEIERIFRTNILAMFWLVKAALPHMQPGSAIVNTASIEAFKANPALTAYASTKGAIIAFTTSLAQQLVKKGIRVNAVAPGPVWTPLIVASKPPELLKKQESQPLKFGSSDPEQRPAQPAELAPAYVFLASPEASYVNGCVLSVTGGEPMP